MAIKLLALTQILIGLAAVCMVVGIVLMCVIIPTQNKQIDEYCSKNPKGILTGDLIVNCTQRCYDKGYCVETNTTLEVYC